MAPEAGRPKLAYGYRIWTCQAEAVCAVTGTLLLAGKKTSVAAGLARELAQLVAEPIFYVSRFVEGAERALAAIVDNNDERM